MDAVPVGLSIWVNHVERQPAFGVTAVRAAAFLQLHQLLVERVHVVPPFWIFDPFFGVVWVFFAFCSLFHCAPLIFQKERFCECAASLNHLLFWRNIRFCVNSLALNAPTVDRIVPICRTIRARLFAENSPIIVCCVISGVAHVALQDFTENLLSSFLLFYPICKSSPTIIGSVYAKFGQKHPFLFCKSSISLILTTCSENRKNKS